MDNQIGFGLENFLGFGTMTRKIGGMFTLIIMGNSIPSEIINPCGIFTTMKSQRGKSLKDKLTVQSKTLDSKSIP